MKSPSTRPSRNTDEQDAAVISPERRQALNRIVAWTPPVMLTLLLSPRPSAASPTASPTNEDTTPPPGGFGD